ncbi:uncharacterized protein B0J16DRAFT_402137 [Fusarium flagelliforme]|uniref:uncharacterized protein n=1 Tax=Fusarium flagelliforme TaxID=2675880 RepID=UPI001E8E539F|nr:uncharacterized protein B0J16DRAFT_402137 [Fusarium flagelliforme]KAH7183613.1 hypothetical protein B0J16DRAFT_402137 [Fusarium flagelliforme]
MDPFQKLPVEITLSIMENIYSHTTIWRLIHASPTMLSHYSANKPALLRKFIVKLIHTGKNDDLLQDAMGILGFDATKTDDQATRRQFGQYTANELHNPLDIPASERDHATIANLHRLFSRLGLFIEDYMGKATASDPVMEYLRHPPEITYTNTKKRVTLDDLSPLERYRLFRAFLKHEVLCKIFDPRLVDLKPQTEWGETSRASWVHMDSRLYESIHCVNEYVEASFGGLFARLAWAQKRHPTDFFKYSKTRGLLYPDTTTVSSLSYFQDLLRTFSCHNVYEWSDGRGLDVLTHLLTHMAKGPYDSPTLLHWFCSISEEYSPDYRDKVWGHFLHDERHLHPRPSEPRGGLSLLLVSKIYEDEDPDHRVEDAATFSNISSTRFGFIESRMYRQRAWMFCDSPRLYPPIHLHFPTKNVICRYWKEAINQILISEYNERDRRRSVEWQDYFTGRTFGKPPHFNGVAIKGGFPENNVQHVPPFFNSSAEGELSTFWRFK